MMDISGSATHFQDFNKDNTVVQEIFTESVDVDLSQGWVDFNYLDLINFF